MPALQNLKGQRFGRWLVLERHPYPSSRVHWLCICDCGTRRLVAGKNLKNGRSISCGCLTVDLNKSRRHILTGKTFGRLTVLEMGKISARIGTYWKCLCLCGTVCEVSQSALEHGRTKSCGCLSRETTSLIKRKPPFEALYNKLCGTAKQSGRDCTITFEEFLEYTTIDKCHYCDDDIEWSNYWDNAGRMRGNYNLDRKDNDKPYTKEKLRSMLQTMQHGQEEPIFLR